jgi:hypothetical protein
VTLRIAELARNVTDISRDGWLARRTGKNPNQLETVGRRGADVPTLRVASEALDRPVIPTC